jgi:hypothetical protein
MRPTFYTEIALCKRQKRSASCFSADVSRYVGLSSDRFSVSSQKCSPKLNPGPVQTVREMVGSVTVIQDIGVFWA